MFNADAPDGSSGGDGNGKGDEEAPLQTPQEQQQLIPTRHGRSSSCGRSRHPSEHSQDPRTDSFGKSGQPMDKDNISGAHVKLKMPGGEDDPARRKSWTEKALNTIYSLNPPPRTISADLSEFGGSKSVLNNHRSSNVPRSVSNTLSSPSVDNRNKQQWGAGSVNIDDLGGLSQVVMEAIPRADGQVSHQILF